MLDRRAFLRLSALLSALPAAGLSAGTGRAAAPRPPATEPFHFRMALGDFEITALCDGYVGIPPKLLQNAPEADIAALLRARFMDPGQPVPTSINAFLVNTGRNLALVDAGVGATHFGDKGGHLLAALAQAGYKPGDVDTVLVTHMHSDHVFGLADADGKAVLPAAVVRVMDAEAAYWLSDEQAAKAPEAKRSSFAMAQKSVADYQASGRFATFAPDEPPLPGVAPRPLPGHTPGHCGFLIESKGMRLLAWGDIVHNHAAQFPRPGVTIAFDVDPKAAAATRANIFARVAREGLPVAGAHLPFPGVGRLAAQGKGYAFVPVEHPAALAGLAKA